MALPKRKISTLREKIEEKAVLEKKLVEVDDKIDEMVGEKKVKIIKHKK